MNSYEPRLNDLKLLTNQLDNKDLVYEIENFSSKWFETYTLISRFRFFFFNFCLLYSFFLAIILLTNIKIKKEHLYKNKRATFVQKNIFY